MLTTQVSHSSVVRAFQPVSGRSWVQILYFNYKYLCFHSHSVILTGFLLISTCSCDAEGGVAGCLLTGLVL